MQLKHRRITSKTSNLYGTETSLHLNKHTESELMDIYVDRLSRHLDRLAQHGPCRVLVANGVRLEKPEVIPVLPDHGA